MFANILKQRDVSKVVWFHADHWEPWSAAVDDAGRRRVAAYAAQAASSPFARKMTLFYADAPNYARLGTSKGETIAVPGDVVEFRIRPEAEAERAREAVREVLALTDNEFQVHIHHEFLTDNDHDWSDLHRDIKANTDPALEEKRLRLLIELSLAAQRLETGLPLDRWAFIHGCWALNGSDPTICKFANEIELLMEYGCWGDFSFPAGRQHCDPTILQQPYSVAPIVAIKGYNTEAAHPVAVDVGAGGLTPDRFLIWNSVAKSEMCSVDVYAPEDRARIGYRDRIFNAWMRECPVIDGVLYIKTHAHSMNGGYFRDGATIPLLYPGVTALFELLRRTCDAAKVELSLATVNQVHRALTALDTDTARQAATPASAAASPRGRMARLETAALSRAMEWADGGEKARRGAGEYYLDRFATGRFFTDYDLYTAEYCVNKLGDAPLAVELGCGLGELSMLLAADGMRTVGIESASARHSGAVTLHRTLTEDGYALGVLSFSVGTYPDKRTDAVASDTSNAVLLCTHITSSSLVENMNEVIRSLVRFRHLIIDVSTFGARRAAARAAELVAEIRRTGFDEVAIVYQDTNADIRHFRRRADVSAQAGLAPAAAH